MCAGTKFSESAGTGTMKIIESNGSVMTVDVKSEARPQLAEKTRQLWDYVSEVGIVVAAYR